MVKGSPRAVQPNGTSLKNARFFLGLAILASIETLPVAECASGDQSRGMGLLALDDELYLRGEASMALPSELQFISDIRSGHPLRKSTKALFLSALFAILMCITFVASVNMLGERTRRTTETDAEGLLVRIDWLPRIEFAK